MSKIVRKIFFPFLIFVFVFLWQGAVSAVEAGPRLYFEPASGEYSVGSEFDVAVKIDTGSQEAMAADALISFDSSRLSVSQVTSGSFFSGFDYNIENSNGKLTVYTFSEQALQTNSGVGNLATIKFEALSEGTASVSFLCQAGDDTDSAIWDQQGNDLVDCAACGSGSYTIGGGTQPTNTTAPTTAPDQPTNTPAPTTAPDAPTPTPSELPETGFEIPLFIFGLGGILMLLLSGALAI